MIKLKPITLSIRHLEKNGYLVGVCEYKTGVVSHDLFGMFDLVAINGITIGVQVTSRSNISARVNKIRSSPNLELVKRSGWKILVQGWDYYKDEPRVKQVIL